MICAYERLFIRYANDFGKQTVRDGYLDSSRLCSMDGKVLGDILKSSKIEKSNFRNINIEYFEIQAIHNQGDSLLSAPSCSVFL